MIDNSPFRARHNQVVSANTLRELYKGGTPKWISHPEDFKNWASECYIRDKEKSDAMVSEYRMEGQDLLTDRKARMIHAIGARDFIQKLRDNGVQCFTYQVPPGPEVPRTLWNTVGLWAEVPSEKALGHLYRGRHHQYICYMDIPVMHEWSLLRLDEHNLPIGEAHRGWRTVLSQLIQKKVLTENKAHEIFGKPALGRQSLKYRKTLYDFRNGRIKPNDRQLDPSIVAG